MLCPNCGFENRQGAMFCPACGTRLQPTGAAQPIGDGAGAPQQYATMRGYAETAPSRGDYVQGKSSFVATIASFFFFAGGQLYNGDFKKAGAIWLAYIVCLIISATGIGTLPAFLLSLVVWAWAIHDAYAVAKGEKATW